MGYISIITIGILACVLTTLPFKAFTQPWAGGRLPRNHKGPLFVQNGGRMQNYFKKSRELPYPPHMFSRKIFVLKS